MPRKYLVHRRNSVNTSWINEWMSCQSRSAPFNRTSLWLPQSVTCGSLSVRSPQSVPSWVHPCITHSHSLPMYIFLCGHLYNSIEKAWIFWVSASLPGAFHQSVSHKMGNSHSALPVARCLLLLVPLYNLQVAGYFCTFCRVNRESISMIPTPQPLLDLESPMLFFSSW